MKISVVYSIIVALLTIGATDAFFFTGFGCAVDNLFNLLLGVSLLLIFESVESLNLFASQLESHVFVSLSVRRKLPHTVSTTGLWLFMRNYDTDLPIGLCLYIYICRIQCLGSLVWWKQLPCW